MAFEEGRRVWLRCDVKPGAFSNERMIRINGTDDPWVGFVPESTLRERDGKTEVIAIILGVVDEFIRAALPGSGLNSSTYLAPKSIATPDRAVEA